MLRQFLSFSPSRVIKCLSRLNDKEVSFTKSRQRILFLTAAGLLIVGGGWFLYSTGFFQAASSQESLRAYIDDFAPYSHLCFFLLQFLSVVLAPIPSNITAAAGGVLFGTWPSFFLTFAAVVAGSLLLFWLARVLGRDFAGRFVSRRLSEKYQQILQTKAPVFLTLAFLFPFFSRRSSVHPGRPVLALIPPLCGDRPACPPLGTALCQRPGRRRLSCLSVGDGFDRCSGVSPVSSGDEIWGSDRSGHPEAPVPAERQ